MVQHCWVKNREINASEASGEDGTFFQFRSDCDIVIQIAVQVLFLL